MTPQRAKPDMVALDPLRYLAVRTGATSSDQVLADQLRGVGAEVEDQEIRELGHRQSIPAQLRRALAVVLLGEGSASAWLGSETDRLELPLADDSSRTGSASEWIEPVRWWDDRYCVRVSGAAVVLDGARDPGDPARLALLRDLVPLTSDRLARNFLPAALWNISVLARQWAELAAPAEEVEFGLDLAYTNIAIGRVRALLLPWIRRRQNIPTEVLKKVLQ